MTIFYSTELANYTATPVIKPDAVKGYGARVRRIRATITMAAQATTDTIVCGLLPAGSVFAFGILTASATLATATVAIGITGTTGKYRAAAVSTVVDTPTFFGPATVIGNQTPLTADETVFITIGTASLPGAGTLVVDLYYTNG